jgi:hypothetical protein
VFKFARIPPVAFARVSGADSIRITLCGVSLRYFGTERVPSIGTSNLQSKKESEDCLDSN